MFAWHQSRAVRSTNDRDSAGKAQKPIQAILFRHGIIVFSMINGTGLSCQHLMVQWLPMPKDHMSHLQGGEAADIASYRYLLD